MAIEISERARERVIGDNALLSLVVSKLLSKQVADFDVAPGEYDVEGELRLSVRARVRRGKDTTRKPTANIPLLPTMAILLKRAGFKRAKALRLIEECVTEAVTRGVGVEGELERSVKDLEELMDRLKRDLSSLPKVPRKGSTRIDGEVRIVDVDMTSRS